MNAFFELIKESNGDILGLMLFILLIIYFISLEEQTYYTGFLLGSCVIALIVDLVTTYKTIKKYYENRYKKHYKNLSFE